MVIPELNWGRCTYMIFIKFSQNETSTFHSGRLIPVQPHLHTLGMPGSFLIAWFDLISFDLRVSTRGQSRLLFWSRYEVLWSRSDCFDNAICVCSWLPDPGWCCSTAELDRGARRVKHRLLSSSSDFPRSSMIDMTFRWLALSTDFREHWGCLKSTDSCLFACSDSGPPIVRRTNPRDALAFVKSSSQQWH